MEVARQIRVSNQAVYFWESEKRIPGVLHLNALARLFECDISDFYKRKKVTEYDEL
jgi:DNA-binding XRE family transcriptional regulator